MPTSNIEEKFNLLLEKMENLNDKYASHAKYDEKHFDEIRGNITKILHRLDTLEICKVPDAKS